MPFASSIYLLLLSKCREHLSTTFSFDRNRSKKRVLGGACNCSHRNINLTSSFLNPLSSLQWVMKLRVDNQNRLFLVSIVLAQRLFEQREVIVEAILLLMECIILETFT